jgi:hypothetical protein
MKRVVVNGRAGSLSGSEQYLILDDDKQHLYVRHDVGAPRYCSPSGGPSVIYSATMYTQYQPVRKFLRDCLHSAEEIIWNAELDLGQVRTKVGGTRFGDTEQGNIAIANAQRNAAGANQNASPAVGQGYALVSTVPDSKYPYHAAGVLAVDGTDRVTLEVFAGAADAQQDDREEPGDFEMYSNAPGQTFHDVWSTASVFAGTNPVTVVIEHI